MLRLAHAILIGLVGAGIIHIVVLLLVPQFTEQDAWSRLAMSSSLYKVTRLDAESGGSPIVKSVDPLFFAAACRFDLSDGVLQVSAKGYTPFWSVSVYNRAGENIYSFNDHTLPDGNIDFIVLTPAQLVDLRKEMPEGLEKSIYVESAANQGIVVVRSFVPDDSWKKSVADFLKGVTCAPQ
ncbi:DUF1254 domain-containing protein [Pseudaminobacter soli (ex Li et al. 2025)]|uniref:DUF1254 domain-containing protein n=1 Tax=Pseudaminobacter soli (ex Li et al. 2025) TaxID=1295366 RepID=A0A2P7SFU0_9HYPH|nr:DUF1254 domain-containing protein [Mesorhizobium soli]PSJ61353.1 DUF1254 domain-containing protein [Mesorhizobium soli]